jgi:hypothetical protein
MPKPINDIALAVLRSPPVGNRLIRVRWRDALALCDRVRVMRTSNCYTFEVPARNSITAAQPSKGNLSRGTGIQVSNPDLFAALDRLKGAFDKAAAPPVRARQRL